MGGIANQASIIRRELLTRMARLLMNRELEAKVDRIPLELRPRGYEGSSRCCVYKDRAVLKYKIIGLLGYHIQDETDELIPLSEYTRKAFERNSISPEPLTVVDEACSACVKVNYVVTNMCRGCVARPCMVNCPKDAIIFEGGQAKIDHSKCVNCGLCQKNCPFHAIIYIPVPCEESCPVGAISKDAKGIEHIDYNKCIYCGKCVAACPFGAVTEKSHFIELFRALREGRKVIGLVAPAIAGQFKAPLSKIIGAIKQLGFYDVIEVAKGADITTANEAAEFKEKMSEGQPFMTTSCSPSFVASVYKHIPELVPFVSHTKTPMYYTAKLARTMYPDGVNVFIGPCLAKRHETFMNPDTDYMLSFEELYALFAAAGIDVAEAEDCELDMSIDSSGRGYPVSGGVSGAIVKHLNGKVDIKTVSIDGINKTSLREMRSFAKKCPGNMVEVMACEGGCVNGCGVIANSRTAAKQITDLVRKQDEKL
ncbi:MAG: monomeric [FeFe] hydrogenase [Rikenellaceae bacterium]|nr:monomeric [FeFe] hydrogenase [Rikenellaceae bacterium]